MSAFRQEEENERLENAIASKAVTIREGASLRTADELAEQFVDDACALLDVNPQVEQYAPEDRSEALSAAVAEYEMQLANAGYTTIWNDGYVIYKNLTEDEQEYANNF